MKPVEFPEQNCVYAKDQPEYLPLPVHKTPDGMVISCWALTWRERFKMLLTGRMWWSVLTFNHPLQPQLPSADKPFTDTANAGGEGRGASPRTSQPPCSACGEGTILRDPRPSLADDGKWRYCERAKGHTGRHMAYYCGRRRYWPNATGERTETRSERTI